MINKLFKWTAGHQVTAFFILTFAITWGLGFSYISVMRGKYLALPLMFTATCGPALAGIIVACIAGTNRPKVKRRVSLAAFFISWIAVTLVFMANHLVVNKGILQIPIIVLVAISALPVAFIVNLIYTRYPIVRSFQLSPFRSGATPGWILTAVLIFPLLVVIPVLISWFPDRQSPLFSGFPASGFGLAVWIVLKFLSQFFFFNGTGEEAGWRGFALPRLQAHVSPLLAGLILSLFWVPWHLFLWMGEGKAVFTLSFWLSSYLLHIPSGIILCWCYNRSRGSLLVAAIAHASANTIVALLRPEQQNVMVITFFVFVAAIVLADRMWKRLPEEHPAVYRAVAT
ncbi:MAG: CPBP family intramembrane glutamic endopeptidase [Lentimicrobium sp.]